MNSSTQVVLLVSPLDVPLGTCSKQEAHVEGKLHRAFSVFLTNEDGEILLQRRALTKYHSGGLWTNACCSHPVGEVLADARVRLMEELGVERCVYVGDSEVDVTTARNAGFPCVTVLWGFRDEPELRAAGADRLCARVSDLYDMLMAATGEIV